MHKINHISERISEREVFAMKKRYLLSALTVVTIAALTACSGTSSAAGQTTAVTPKYESAESADISAAQTTTPQAESVSTAAAETAASGSITEDQARAAALADAGVTEDQVSRIRIKTDRDDGRDIYEVEFYVDQSEYDYDIDMATGAILSKDYDIKNDFFTGDTSGQTSGTISEDEAINIVLQRVSGAQASDVWIKQDRDDGRLVYEGELYYNNTEYEFEMDASTGDILEWSEESRSR